MKRWIRWSYLLPRLVVVVLLIVASEYGIGYLIQTTVIQSGEAALGAKVDVKNSTASLLRTRAKITGLQIANPRSPMRNLVEADTLFLDFDTSSLLRKQAVIDTGSLHGLRFDTPRETSGKLESSPVEVTSSEPWISDETSEAAQQWLADLGDQFGEDLLENFESVQVSERLLAEWPNKYSTLEQRIRTLKQRTKALQNQLQTAKSNPLRHLELIQKLPNEITSLQQEIGSLHAELASLPDQLETDRRAILAARKHDEQFIREHLKVESLNPQSLTQYLLGEQLQQRMATAIGWLRWARQVMPAKDGAPEPTRSRGEDIFFAGNVRTPDFLIRNLELHGATRLAGGPVELFGSLQNLTNQPKLLGKPFQLNLTTLGALPVELQATIDRTGEIAKDQFAINCASFVIPKINLGKQDNFGVAIDPSVATLNINVVLTGDKLSGDIQLVQQQVAMTPSLGQRLQSLPIAASLADSLSNVHSLSTRIELSGTLDRPHGKITSNLGHVVVDAMNHSLHTFVEDRTQQLLARSQKQIDEKLTQLDGLVSFKQAQLLPELNEGSEWMNQLASHLGKGGKISVEKLGRQFPLDSLFK